METPELDVDWRMGHIIVELMKQASIRELKNEMSKVLAMVEAGETVEVRRRKQTVAILSPPGRNLPVKMPDFAARMKAIYGEGVLASTGTDLVGESRGIR